MDLSAKSRAAQRNGFSPSILPTTIDFSRLSPFLLGMWPSLSRNLRRHKDGRCTLMSSSYTMDALVWWVVQCACGRQSLTSTYQYRIGKKTRLRNSFIVHTLSHTYSSLNNFFKLSRLSDFGAKVDEVLHHLKNK